MKKTLLLFSLFACFSCVVQAGTCVGGFLDTYTAAGFSCVFDGITFSNFQYDPTASGGAVTPDAHGVSVNPETIGSEGGFLFTGGFLVGPGEVEDSTITYTATCVGCLIDDLVLIMGGGASGTGLASVSETSTSVTPNVNLLTGESILSDMTTFTTGVGSITLTKDIGVSGGTDGFAHISAVTNLFSTNTTTTMTPEPALGLLCVGLLGMVPVARRKLGRL
jgi:hypothetical protein